MRGLLPLARLARSIVRASSMSSTVWLICRSKVLALTSCLLSCVQLPGGVADVKVALPINVFSVADIIHHEASAFQLKERAVIAGSKAILVLETLQLFDVPSQIVLGAVKFRANQTAGDLGQGAELLQCRRQEFNLIAHLPARGCGD